MLVNTVNTPMTKSWIVSKTYQGTKLPNKWANSQISQPTNLPKQQLTVWAIAKSRKHRIIWGWAAPCYTKPITSDNTSEQQATSNITWASAYRQGNITLVVIDIGVAQ